MDENNKPDGNTPMENNAPMENSDTSGQGGGIPENGGAPELFDNLPSENGPKTSDNVSFDANKNIPLVANVQESKKSKLPIIITACVLAIAIIIGCIIYFVKSDGKDDGDIMPYPTEDYSAYAKNLSDYLNESLTEEITDESGSVLDRKEYVSKIQQQVQEATTTLSENVGVTSPHAIETPAADKDNNVQQGTQAENTQQLQLAEAQIEAFFNRTCYLRGAIYSNNSGDSVSMAFDGDNIEFLTNLDGTEVSIMRIDGKTYLKRPATKQYMEFTEPVMNLLGISADDFSFNFNTANYDDMKKLLNSTYDVKLDDKDGVCYEYKNNSRIFRFYSVDGELKQLDICDEDGTIDTQLSIDYFSTSIPADQLTLKGYTESTMGAIFADLMDE